MAASKILAGMGALASILSAPEMDEDLAGRVRARQIRTVRGLIPVMMLAQLINGAIVLLAFWTSGAESLLGAWATFLCLLCGITALRAAGSLPADVRQTAGPLAVERLAHGAGLTGLAWAVVPVIVIPYTGSLGHMALGIILAANCFAGAFLLARIPAAAYAFIGPILFGQIIGMQMQGDPVYDLLSILSAVYGVMLVLCIQWSHARFVEQLINEQAVRDQEQLIGLLLRDFGESTSDLLWQTDEQGCLTHLPVGLNGDKPSEAFMTAGRGLVDLFGDCEARGVLAMNLERRRPFRDLVMPVETGEGEEWWLLTGKPVIENGFFAGFRGVASNVTASKESEDRISRLAHYDVLTGLPNRVTLMEALERHVRTKLAPDVFKALLWLDLDNFKWVNDTLGHPAGDDLLRLVADRISGACGANDLVARLGGDEFAVIVERTGHGGEIEAFVRDLSAALAKPYSLMGSSVRCSASIGLRHFDVYSTDAATLLKHADLALYKAKGNGRAGWAAFTPELEHQARQRRELEEDLQGALEHNELMIFFQPQIDAKTREMTGCEALQRWAHPTRGLVYPADFIEAAEDCGLITRIGDWVIRTTLEQARRLPDNVRVAVNISPLQVHSANLFPTIVNALARNEIDPARLDLEITESVLMTDTGFTLDRLHQLKQLGVRISLDDFGTGFSSLSYLRKFPFDKIKIDKSFISDLETSEDSRAITVATLGLARSLGLRCTAEGVETEFQSRFLGEHGCDELQGYFISRAQPIDKLGHFVTVKPRSRDAEPVAPARPRPQPLTLVAFNGETLAAKQEGGG